MAIIINIDVMLAKRKMSVTELSERVGITMANISILKNGKAKAIKVDTLDKICRALECQPGDLLEWRKEDGDKDGREDGEENRRKSRDEDGRENRDENGKKCGDKDGKESGRK